MTEIVFAKLRELSGPEQKFIGPTQIGLALGRDYNAASSSIVPHLKKLVKAGRVEKQAGGKYRPVA